MEDWIERDILAAAGTNDTEREMVDAVAVYEPPKATPWCAFCSVFGHSASHQCPDKSEWLSRAPLTASGRPIASRPGNRPSCPSRPGRSTRRARTSRGKTRSASPAGTAAPLSFPRLAPKDCSVLCPTCSLQNHPSSSPSPSRSLRLKLALPTRPDQRLPPRPTSPLQRIQESARYSPAPAPPSAAVLPLWNWPQTQPYFLPTKLYLCQYHLEADLDAPINRARPQGGRAMCYRCWAIAATYDAEDDVAIACTDPVSVAGCGEKDFFDYRTGFKGCRCAGGVPALGYALAAAA